ncbi:MAG: hypothetical protein AAF921_10610 [Cyanobacteria bacterium P01_D01_bin.44]
MDANLKRILNFILLIEVLSLSTGGFAAFLARIPTVASAGIPGEIIEPLVFNAPLTLSLLMIFVASERLVSSNHRLYYKLIPFYLLCILIVFALGTALSLGHLSLFHNFGVDIGADPRELINSFTQSWDSSSEWRSQCTRYIARVELPCVLLAWIGNFLSLFLGMYPIKEWLLSTASAVFVVWTFSDMGKKASTMYLGRLCAIGMIVFLIAIGSHIAVARELPAWNSKETSPEWVQYLSDKVSIDNGVVRISADALRIEGINGSLTLSPGGISTKFGEGDQNYAFIGDSILMYQDGESVVKLSNSGLFVKDHSGYYDDARVMVSPQGVSIGYLRLSGGGAVLDADGVSVKER